MNNEKQSAELEVKPIPYLNETVINYNGQKVVRIKSSFFYLVGMLSVVAGIIMMSYEIPGGTFLFLNCTIFFLYPAVRFLFGGKDSVAGVIATFVVDAFIKSKIEESVKKRRKK